MVLSSDPSISELSDPTKLSQLLEETSRLRGFVEEIDRYWHDVKRGPLTWLCLIRSKKKTDCELVNLRINLEEAKNENSTVLQVWPFFTLEGERNLIYILGVGKYS